MARRKDNRFNPVFSWKNRVVDPFITRTPGTRRLCFNAGRQEMIDANSVPGNRRRDTVGTMKNPALPSGVAFSRKCLKHPEFQKILEGRTLPPIALEGKSINLVVVVYNKNAKL